MEKKLSNHTVSCICGEVKFNVKLDELPRVFNCHCRDCRKKIGGIISIIQLREGAIDLDISTLGKFQHYGGSGNKITKHYCKSCAAPILTHVSRWDKYYLYAGILDDISILKKAINIHYEDSHFPFMEISEHKLKI